MAYIPPHKRHSKETTGRLLPTPEQLAPRSKKSLIINPSDKSDADTSSKFVYANHATTRWCAIGLEDQNLFPPTISLEPISLESSEWNAREKPLALMNSCLANGGEVRWELPQSPWECIAENVLEGLLSSFQNLKNEMKLEKPEEEVHPILVARVGKVLFHRHPSVNMEERLDPKILKQWKRSFYADVTASYTENIVKEVVPKIGLGFEEEKDIYHVKLFDCKRTDSIITCKCSVTKEHGKLQLQKIELNQLRHMVRDISCPNNNLDLRIMLCAKRIVTALPDEEMESIRDLLGCAVLDPNVKGGLRWPLGTAFSGDRYKVVGIWHTITSTYENPSLKLKVRYANRYDFRYSAGEVSREIVLLLKRVLSKLQEQNIEAGSVFDLLQEDVRLIWDNFF